MPRRTIVLFQDSVIYNAEMAVLSGYLKSRGFECRVVIEDVEGPQVLERIAALRPDIVAVPTEIRPHNCISEGGLGTAETVRQIVRRVCSPVVLFGKQASIASEQLAKDVPEVHAVIEGDPEHALECLLQGMSRGEISGVVYPDGRGGTARGPAGEPLDLADMPLPDFESFYRHAGSDRLGFYASVSRGCVYKCSFCQIGAAARVYGPAKIRFYPVEWVISGLERLCRDYGPVKTVYMTDTNLTLNKKHARELLEAYRERIGLPYVAATRPDLIDEEMADLLARSGCSKVNLGIESGLAEIRNDLLSKNLSDESIRRAVKLLRERGIRSYGNVIMGLPGEGFDQTHASLKAVFGFGVDGVNVSLFQPLAGTPLAELAVAQGHVTEAELSGLRSKGDGRLSLRLPDARRIENLSQVAPLMRFFRSRVVYALVCSMPRNNLYMLVYHLPRIMRSLRYEFADQSVSRKTGYFMRNFWRVLATGQRALNR